MVSGSFNRNEKARLVEQINEEIKRERDVLFGGPFKARGLKDLQVRYL